MSTGAKAENQNGPPSGAASGPDKQGLPATLYKPGQIVGGADGSKPSDGTGGTK